MRKIRVGLQWHSMTSENLGVGALTLSNIAIVEEAARKAGVSVEFVILGWTDADTPYFERDNVHIVGLRLKDFIKPRSGLFSQIRRCDLVLDIGAGDSFADIYGLKRFGTVLASKVLTLLARRPLVLSPQTIGPFKRPWVRRLALGVMNRATVVAARDDLSVAFLRDLGFRGKIIAASDVALRLPYAPAAKPQDGPVRIGLNVSGLLFSGGYTRDNMFGLRSPYPEVIRALLTRLTAQPGIEVHLVPHVISERFAVEDDHRTNMALAKEFPSVILAPKFSDPIAAKGYISGLDFFAGGRMHACIAAFSSGVPVLPMAYSRKFAGLFGAIGYTPLVDCTTDNTEQIVAAFGEALTRRQAIADEMAQCLARGLMRLDLYETALVDQLRVASAKQARA
ncbi:polysaccharide pyruvyl transferase family protein [Phaeovulum sp.]|uniref:polysaccharide pyruvyl transferase family protein n=1 Tax=Phaeovulum sp. TaxID=2934796 RepID=UPI0039E48D83